jgi:hypothetical protein
MQPAGETEVGVFLGVFLLPAAAEGALALPGREMGVPDLGVFWRAWGVPAADPG